IACLVTGYTRPPTLRRLTDKIAVLRERFGVCLELRRKEADVIARGFKLPRVAAGQKTGPRGGALCVGCIGMREEQPLAGHAVKGRIFPLFAPEATRVTKPQIAGSGQKDFGRITNSRLIFGFPISRRYTEHQDCSAR